MIRVTITVSREHDGSISREEKQKFNRELELDLQSRYFSKFGLSPEVLVTWLVDQAALPWDGPFAEVQYLVGFGGLNEDQVPEGKMQLRYGVGYALLMCGRFDNKTAQILTHQMRDAEVTHHLL